MIHNNFKIREIQPQDNPKIAQAIRDILIEFNVPKHGTAYSDKVLDALSDVYTNEKAIYIHDHLITSISRSK